MADRHVPIPRGQRIAFLAGSSTTSWKTSCTSRVRAGLHQRVTIISEDFADTEDLARLLRLDREHRTYDFEAWRVPGRRRPGLPRASRDRLNGNGRPSRFPRGVPREAHGSAVGRAPSARTRTRRSALPERVPAAEAAFLPYTPEMVEQICGISRRTSRRRVRGRTSNLRPGPDTALVYTLAGLSTGRGAVHPHGWRSCRRCLGNMGRRAAGSWPCAAASIQGSTDIPTLFDLLPASGPCRTCTATTTRGLRAAEAMDTASGQPAVLPGQPAEGLWGPAATPDNDFCYGYLPRLTGSHGTYETVLASWAGDCPGYFLSGENRPSARPTPGCSG